MYVIGIKVFIAKKNSFILIFVTITIAINNCKASSYFTVTQAALINQHSMTNSIVEC